MAVWYTLTFYAQPKLLLIVIEFSFDCNQTRGLGG